VRKIMDKIIRKWEKSASDAKYALKKWRPSNGLWEEVVSDLIVNLEDAIDYAEEAERMLEMQDRERIDDK
jgi:hypothetical protein